MPTENDEAPDTPGRRFSRLVELSPSAKLVYRVLERADQPLTQQELRERSLLPARTVRYALSKLDGETLIQTHPVILDARKQAYTERPVERPE